MKLRVRTEGERRARAVAIAGAKGSPGCTFLAVGLARCLVASGLPALLVDADAEEPGVAAALALPGGPATDLAQAATLGLDPEVLQGATSEAGGGLRVLELAGQGPFGALAGLDVDGRELLVAARQAVPAVVIDLGHSWGPLQRQLAAAADWLLWVLVPDRLGVERADRALSGLAPAASRGLVVNRATRWSLGGAERTLVERHHLPLVARFPEHRRCARVVSERGGAAHRQRPFRAGLLRVARTVHPDLEGGGTWP
jgi:Flp pilus assembly CpaE family ATPase